MIRVAQTTEFTIDLDQIACIYRENRSVCIIFKNNSVPYVMSAPNTEQAKTVFEDIRKLWLEK